MPNSPAVRVYSTAAEMLVRRTARPFCAIDPRFHESLADRCGLRLQPYPRQELQPADCVLRAARCKCQPNDIFQLSWPGCGDKLRGVLPECGRRISLKTGVAQQIALRFSARSGSRTLPDRDRAQTGIPWPE